MGRFWGSGPLDLGIWTPRSGDLDLGTTRSRDLDPRNDLFWTPFWRVRRPFELIAEQWLDGAARLVRQGALRPQFPSLGSPGDPGWSAGNRQLYELPEWVHFGPISGVWTLRSRDLELRNYGTTRSGTPELPNFDPFWTHFWAKTVKSRTRNMAILGHIAP